MAKNPEFWVKIAEELMRNLPSGPQAGSNHEKARVAYGVAIDLNPKAINVLISKAIFHAKRWEDQVAILLFKNVLEIDPNNQVAKEGIEKVNTREYSLF